jgi:UDP-N-acetylglucosamine:LPS N-acetylglucosamine transferase
VRLSPLRSLVGRRFPTALGRGRPVMTLRVLVVTSVGGHLTEVMQLAPALRQHRVTLVVNDAAAIPEFPFHAVYRISHAERDWRVLYNFAEAARILREELPDVVVSMGAGPAVPFAIVGRYLVGSRILFVETAAAVRKPTLTGRLLYPIADRFFYQWPEMKVHFPRSEQVHVLFR